MTAKTIAVVGASADRRKFGNKCVRAFASAGWTVFPVHPTETAVEGLPVYRSVADVPVERLDVVSVYLNPKVGLGVLPTFTAKTVGELWFNPGAESAELLAKAKELGLHAIPACSIVGYGMNPHTFADE
jgi:predicted CoA-binding protein